MYKRPLYNLLRTRLEEPRRFIQVLSGPRQAGKTTLIQQVLSDIETPGHYASADEPSLQDRPWIEQQWATGRRLAADPLKAAVLVLDEVQKVPEWSTAVKRLWDEDSASGLCLKVVLLGSSPLLVQAGLAESLAGRFELIPVTHWSYPEMAEAFGFSLEQYLVYGGYPGAAGIVSDPERWVRYISDSLIETTLSRDILLLTRLNKPALLRRLFYLACEYAGQILSYQKMLGQLHDAGNTTTLAHYLNLLAGAGMVAGLQKFAGQQVRQRASSPKLVVMNTGLMTASLWKSVRDVRADPERFGRLVEAAVGAYLVNASRAAAFDVFYWRDRGREVDYVIRRGDELAAIEVKSGRRPQALPGMKAFGEIFHPKAHLLVGEGGVPVGEFLSIPPEEWLT